MERCRFCLESIVNEAFSCKHCGLWQPTKEEINSAYRHVLSTLVKETLGEKKWKRVNFLRRIAIFSFYLFVVLFIVLAITYMFKLSWIDGLTDTIWGSLFLSFFLMLLSGTFGGGTISKYRKKIVFENALLIEKRLNEQLQNNLREQQLSKNQRHKPVLLYSLTALLFFTTSNPTKQEFIDYYATKTNRVVVQRPVSEKSLAENEVIVSRINFILCSIHATSKNEVYVGVLGSFFP